MKVIHKIKIHLDDNRMLQPVEVMQGDANTRLLEFSLYAEGKEWTVPADVSVSVAYFGASGRGAYDTLPDGSAAYTVNGNVVQATLIQQVTAVFGTTTVTVVFTDGTGKQLAAFGVPVKVERNAAVGAGKPQNYYNLREWVSAGPLHISIEAKDGGWFADRDYDEIRQEQEASREIICHLEQNGGEDLELRLIQATPAALIFGALVDGVEWQAVIRPSETEFATAEVTSTACGREPLYVTLGTGGGVYIADATFEDIQAAHQQGRDVYCCSNVMIMTLVGISATTAVFSADIATTHYDARIKSDGTVTISWYDYPKVDDLKQVTPQMFGAVGDGVVDDTEAFKNAITKCNAESMTLLVPAGTYNLTDILDFDGLTISGVDAEKCVLRMTAQATEREHFISCYNKVSISNITFRQSYKGAILGMFGCNDAIVENCVVIVDEGIQNNGYFDLYQSNNNIRVVNCKFLNFSKQSAGGLWVRNCQNTVSENIIFEKCVMEHATNDEVFAVWGWVGTVQDVTFRDCTFMCMGETSSTHMMTLGMTGITKNVTLDHCFIKNNFATMYTIKSSAETETSVTENIRVNDCNIYVSGDGATGGLPVFGKNIIFTNCDIAVNREQYLSAMGNVFNNCRIELRNSLYARGPTTSNHCDIILRGPGLFAMSSATFKDCTIDFDNVKNNKFLFQPDGGELFRMDGCEWKNCPGFEAWMIFNELSDITVEFTNCKGVTGTVYCMAENFTLIAIGNTMNNFNTMVGDNTKHIYNNFIDGVFLPSGLPS